MKRFLTFALLITIISSCSKSTADNTTPPIDPSKTYSIDFDLNNQIVMTSVTNNTLNLDYYEQVDFIVDPVEYGRLWALILVEDFSKSNLKDLHFSALSNENVYATDWVSQNLNNVHPSQKTVIDTTIGGKGYKKIKIARLFKFISPFSTQQDAINKQNSLLQTTQDSVTFSSSYYYSGVYSKPKTAGAKLIYKK